MLRRLSPDDPALGEVLTLIQSAFAYMDGRIDPPSSMHRLTLADLRQSAATGEVWAIGAPLQACVVLSPKADRLYLGKLAVAANAQGLGLARVLVDRAARSAAARRLPVVELQVRVELTENIRTFERLGFVEVGRTAHAGYSRPTSVTMHKKLGR